MEAATADKLILHDLYLPQLMLAAVPGLSRRIYWKTWGDDLYFNEFRDRTFKLSAYEMMRRLLIPRIPNICTGIQDNEQLIERYRTRARFYQVWYPNVIDLETLDTVRSGERGEGMKPGILIGNSADPKNGHIEVMEALVRLGERESFKVVCPLGYGDRENARKVESAGRTMFGDDFVALKDFLVPSEYARVLSSVDAAIMNHTRVQGFGTILGLLYLGKKLFIREDRILPPFLQSLGISAFDTRTILDGKVDDIFRFDEDESENNFRVIRSRFSDESIVAGWREVFDS